MIRETTSRSRDLCGLVCPSRTSDRGGEGDCVKEGRGEEGERERECALGICHPGRPGVTVTVTVTVLEMCVVVYYCSTYVLLDVVVVYYCST